MSDKKISELPFGILTPDSIIPIVSNCVTSQVTFGDLLSNITGFSGSDTYTTGGTYNNGTATFTNNTGGIYKVTGFTSSTGSTGSTPTLQQVLDYNHDLLNGKNFQGTGAGSGTTSVSESNFFGTNAGRNATSANNSNFLGNAAGYGATNAEYSNFLGNSAGSGATGAEYSNFIGNEAGNQATNGTYSNFLGNAAGFKATNARDSNFLGAGAGYLATNASNSNFIGLRAGLNATGASFSNFFGFHVGRGDVLGSVGSNNIIIGTNISLPSGTTNSINLGGVLFGRNTYATSAGIPSISAQTNGRIGINKVIPTTTLHIYSETANTSGLRLERLVSSSPTTSGNVQAIGVDSSGNIVTITGGTGGGGGLTPSLQQVLDYNHDLINGMNFQGTGAGDGATNANESNFFGTNTGFGAIGANNSNFLGNSAGYGATSASYSNLFGYQAGLSFTNNNIGSNNIIIGKNISLPSGTTNSINLGGVLFGINTYATNSINPSISAQTTGRIGINKVIPTTTLHIYSETANTSGLRLERLTSSSPTSTGKAIGVDASGNIVTITAATGGSSSTPSLQDVLDYDHDLVNGLNRQGSLAGNGTTGKVNDSNFFGYQAGYLATGASYSNFFGFDAGRNATNANNSNFFGESAGRSAISAFSSNFFGSYAGDDADNANNSNFFGAWAGYQTFSAYSSNFLGFNAGRNAVYANNSNFMGTSPGYQASGANNSNFMGWSAGFSARYANNSNFFGNNAGYEATNANNSNFFGNLAGGFAKNANNSNFIGYTAGQYATTGASNSNFIGQRAGYHASGTSYSNLFGWNVGNGQMGSIGSNNIIIGRNISLSAETTNSINLGGVLFGINTYAITAGTPSITGETSGRIGINKVIPLETLDVNGAIKLGSNSYTGLTNNAVTPVPNGGAGTMIFDPTSLHFFGWNGSAWKQLDN